MIPDLALRPPRRYALLAMLLVVPSLVLSGLALRALRLDRRTAEADLAERASELANRMLTRLTQLLAEPVSPPSGEVANDEDNDLVLRVNQDHELLSPRAGVWPPVPRARPTVARDGADPLTAYGWLMRAHDLRDRGSAAEAVEAYHRALARGGAEALTESGVSVGAVALHAILDLTEGHPEQLPRSWMGGRPEAIAEVLALDTTPISESALERFEQRLAAAGADTVPAEGRRAFETALRRRTFLRGAHAALAATRSVRRPRQDAPGRVERPWAQAMSFQLDREVWLAVRTSPPAIADRTLEASEFAFRLRRWNEVFERLRESHRENDPRGQFGFAVAAHGPDFQVDQEEPSGVTADATARATAVLFGGGLRVTTAVQLLDPAAYAAPRLRRERWLGGSILGAVAVSGLAAAFAWRLLARQHRLNVQKSNFVAAVSHELRAPLASVRLLADNLEHGRVPDEGRRAITLRLIGRECRRLGALVDNVLDLSRIERGKRRLEREPTDIAGLVRETVRLARVAGEERQVGIGLAIDPGAEELVAEVDGAALRQALGNLLDNALKHAPPGSEVEVALALPPRSPHFLLAVTDHGPGVPPAERERIFEPFHRLGRELRREQPGIGIGLAIVRHTVRAHGGRMRIEPVEPSGARFVLQLPVGTDPGSGLDPEPERS